MQAKTFDQEMKTGIHGDIEHASSAVAWPAIIGGAFATIAISLILLILGSGLGLVSVSPWGNNPSPVTFTVITVIWLIIMQWVASGVGGYITGRLRNRFFRMHNDEVFFRDTAHGFLTWAVATLFTAAFLTSAVSSVISSTVHAVSTVTAGAAAGAAQNANNNMHDLNAYYVDRLFRSEIVNNEVSHPEIRAETTRILINGLKTDVFPEEDKHYVIQLIVAKAGVSEDEATQRVDTIIEKANEAKADAKKAADTARKAGASLSIFTVLSMLIGAFIASVAAALGGRHRDEY